MEVDIAMAWIEVKRIPLGAYRELTAKRKRLNQEWDWDWNWNPCGPLPYDIKRDRII
jgi:hypothetical protein